MINKYITSAIKVKKLLHTSINFQFTNSIRLNRNQNRQSHLKSDLSNDHAVDLTVSAFDAIRGRRRSVCFSVSLCCLLLDACPVVPCSQLDTTNSHSTTTAQQPNHTQPFTNATEHNQVIHFTEIRKIMASESRCAWNWTRTA